jgi:hypothetical protein
MNGDAPDHRTTGSDVFTCESGALPRHPHKLFILPNSLATIRYKSFGTTLVYEIARLQDDVTPNEADCTK